MNSTTYPCATHKTRLFFAFLLLAFMLPTATFAQGVSDEGGDPGKAGRFDNGKMWTFEHPPAAYFQEAYGFEPDADWFERARLGALRIPGCSASFASPNGLVLTNHHCGRGSVSQVSAPGENLLDNGFYAPSLDEERRVADYYADQLIALTDVTAEIYAALEGMETDAEKAQARQDAINAATERIKQAAGGDEAGIHVEVISLYHGGQYSAYTFRRYNDVRLVMAPELKLGYFGGDSDNFTYPRYALDMTLFRVYDADGTPLKNQHYFKWKADGSDEGDAVFVIGNPGSTYRLETVAQLEFRRDVEEVSILDLFNSRVGILKQYYEESPEKAEELGIRNLIFSLMNSQKLYTGRVKALHDPVIMARRQDTEQQFRAAVMADSTLTLQYGDSFDRMASIKAQMQELAPEFGAFLGMQPGGSLAAGIMQRALLGYIYLAQTGAGVPESNLGPLLDQLKGIGDRPETVERGFTAARFADFIHYFGDDAATLRAMMFPQTEGADAGMLPQMQEGYGPGDLADAVRSSSVLVDSASTASALAEGTLTMDDPAVKIMAAYFPRLQRFQSAFAGLGAQEQEVASALGRARFDVYGTTIPPDATFSLRIADGVVASYNYNGTRAPAYTTFYGLYNAYHASNGDPEWALPERWLNPPSSFDLSTPINMVTTADIIGGNSGSPLVNKDLELVGLMFDGNIESLSGDYIYLTKGVRSVAVDVRGILEALDDVFDADRLVLELTTGTLAKTEAEADEMQAGGR